MVVLVSISEGTSSLAPDAASSVFISISGTSVLLKFCVELCFLNFLYLKPKAKKCTYIKDNTGSELRDLVHIEASLLAATTLVISRTIAVAAALAADIDAVAVVLTMA